MHLGFGFIAYLKRLWGVRGNWDYRTNFPRLHSVKTDGPLPEGDKE
jgi:hypothetical protein